MRIFLLWIAVCASLQLVAQEKFPDGTPVPEWFKNNEQVKVATLGKPYRLTDYGVINDSTVLQTEKIQEVIDLAASNGGGVLVVPSGTFLSGSLFFKPGTHLHIEANGVLKGSDDISHFPVVLTRMEGQTLKYFAALVNADGLDGFTISGAGTINGNGLRYWKSFWLRREVNPGCTNMDEQRPRLVYLSNCKNVQLEGVRLMNSPFWTTHLYKCEHVKLLNLHISSPKAPVKAPSTDAIDLDACRNILIKNCYMSVNDDAVALKGGKGPWADRDSNNGANENIIIEDCQYGFCHSALTFGSESIHSRNIIFRRGKLDQARNLLWLKMRPDTPQIYEYILVEDMQGNANNCLLIKPWTQFFDMKDRKTIPPSSSRHVTMRNIQLECEVFFNVEKSNQYRLTDFVFENMQIQAKDGKVDKSIINPFTIKNVTVNDQKLKP
ncbi:polygalacturonase [Bacteroides reticulotermitis]|nr:glycosyl hydrolase family 28 protein [Bacteroides reticulotermitis]MBB4044245.1 polygalacturonase [Bacteroides reticulotermitis]